MNVKETLEVTQDKKAKILEAAKARFMYYGVSKTTTRDIAEDLGISVSNLYLYFENKREIVLAIAQECRADQIRSDQEVLSDDSLTPPQKLECALVEKFRRLNRFKADNPKSPELIAYLLQEYPERILSWQEHLESLIAAVLDEGVRTGDFRIDDVSHHTRMLRVGLTQFFQPVHVKLPIEPTEEELVAYVRWYLSFVAQPAESEVHR
jgi:AcrR family transcriptional regulator